MALNQKGTQRRKKKLGSKKKPNTASYQVRVRKDFPWQVLRLLLTDAQEYIGEGTYNFLSSVTESKDPLAYLALSDRLGLQSMARDEVDLGDSAFVYLYSSIFKKYRDWGVITPSARKDAAKRSFLASEQSCAELNTSEFGTNCPQIADTVFRMMRFFEVLLGDSPLETEVTDGSRHGPGACTQTVQGKVARYFKYTEWPYHVTEHALPYARSLIESDERWFLALWDSYRRKFELPLSAVLDVEAFWRNILLVVPGNRITFVPKSAVTDRAIAIEPTMNLLLQLGVDGFIRKRLKRYGCNLNTQVKNQTLACVGSVRDSHSTIDLAAASDSLSSAVVKLLLPDAWYRYLMAIRSPSGDLDGDEIFYQKISSMGNGTTFALESAVFFACIFGCMQDSGGYSSRDVAVHGDDLVCPTYVTDRVIRVLSFLGFQTNVDKTFIRGPVRESCGADWLNGNQIRPVYCYETPKTVFDVFSLRNHLRRWMYFHTPTVLSGSRTLSALESYVPPKWKHIVGPCSDDEFDTYLHVERPPKGSFRKEGVFIFRSFTRRPIGYKGLDEFYLGRLSHNLRTASPKPSYLSKVVDSGSGSRFDPLQRSRWRVNVSARRTPDWCSRYETAAVGVTPQGPEKG